jgi:gliding motility-associated-like protein
VNLPAGFYQLSVRDAQNCVTATANTAIIEPLPLESFITGTNPGCPGLSNGSINLLANGGTPPYTFSWSNGATTQNLSNVGSGAYTVIITDVQGCVITDTITLSNASELLAPATIVDVLCYGAADGSITLAVTGGTAPYSFNWNPANADSNAITGLSGGTYEVVITDAAGCTANFSYEVNESAELTLSISTTDITCFGDEDGMATTTLNGGTPNYTYTWSDGQNTVVANGLGAGAISLTVTDGNNCSATANGNITGPDLLTVTIDSLFNVNCFDGSDGRLYLNASGGRPNYIYSVLNNVFQSTPNFSGLDAGDYTALVLDTNNCRAILPFTITEPADWQVLFDDPYVFTSRGAEVQLEAEHNNPIGVIQYVWSPTTGLSCTDCPNPEASPLETTTYTLTAIDSNGCESSEQIAVVIKNRYEIFFPNAFSPNGDGLNDVWAPIDYGSAGEIQIQIFNRWGELVFESNDVSKGWDGTYKGELLAPDNFVYHVEGLFLDGEEFKETGTIALLR